jgi:deoxyribonuclease V
LNEKQYFEEIQEELISKICLDNRVDIDNLHAIAGVDLAYWKQKDKEYACCCIVVLDYTDFSIIEKKHSVGEITVPYIPGCLAFREYDLVEKTVSLLENKVDLFAFDGNGYLHPRHTKVRGTVLMSCFPFNLR